MTVTAESDPAQRGAAPSWRARLWSSLQLLLAILIAIAALVFILWSPFGRPATTARTGDTVQNAAAVKPAGPGLISIRPDTPLQRKLAISPVNSRQSSAPILKVTGAVVARLPPGNDHTEGRWDFSTADLAGAYVDWLKARADVPYSEKQLATIRELTVAQVAAKTEVAARLEKLVNAGTDPEKDLAAAKADLLQAKLQGQKDEHEAETNWKNALRSRATLERQLFQAGIDPDLLLRDTPGKAIVVAEVPEARVGLVVPEQACQAQFYAFPDIAFSGRVGSLAPTLSKDRRTLRVFFELEDPQGRLKPGMFAEIGLGTELREVLLVPVDGLLHVGRCDYMLVATEPGVWKITEVKSGELYGDRIEILHGLKARDQVIGAGAILLKPFVVEDLQGVANRSPNSAAAGEQRGS